MQDSFDSRVVKKATFAMFQHSIVFCLQNTLHVFLPVLPFLRIIEQRLPFFPLSPGGPTSPFIPFSPGTPAAPISPGRPWCPLNPGQKKQIKQSNGYSLFLCHLKLRSKIFPKRSQAAKGGTSSLKRFSKKLLVPRNSKTSKRRNGVLTLPW